MTKSSSRILHHFALFRFREVYYSLSAAERGGLQSQLIAGLEQSAGAVHWYQIYPARTDADILVWSAVVLEDADRPGQFFSAFSRATNPCRGLVEPQFSFWGFTRPSEYTKGGSTREMDAFAEARKPYLILYPFTKTTEWYMMSPEARQGMMNEHIKIGKQHPEILQLLLYSTGLQDHEFVVVYETNDLTQFSDLVRSLRTTEARRFTLSDTPTITATYHSPEETFSLWQ